MPKLKSKSGAKKRFRVTGSGKILRNHAGHRHFLAKKAKKVKRAQRRTAVMAASDRRIVLKYLPYHR
jgi:large subunit ribosomal protein L35